MARVYRIAWVEEQQILECYRHNRLEMEQLKKNLMKEGLHPFITCDFTENFEEEDLKINIGKIQIRKTNGA